MSLNMKRSARPATLTTVGQLKVERSHRIVNRDAPESKLPSGVAKQ